MDKIDIEVRQRVYYNFSGEFKSSSPALICYSPTVIRESSVVVAIGAGKGGASILAHAPMRVSNTKIVQALGRVIQFDANYKANEHCSLWENNTFSFPFRIIGDSISVPLFGLAFSGETDEKKEQIVKMMSDRGNVWKDREDIEHDCTLMFVCIY